MSEATHRPNRRMVVAAVLATSFLAAMEATVVSTAMPTVIAALGGIERYSWVFSAYILSSTVMLPIWGKLADLYGRRRLILAALLLFLTGSTLCGAARSIDQLILFRALQGLGAGGLVPLGMTILGDLYTPTQRARMQGYFSSVWGLASIAGPILGGYLTDHLSWRWVFFINLPIGFTAGALIHRYLREHLEPRELPIDYLGAATLAAAASTLLISLTDIGSSGLFTSARPGLLLLTSVLLAAAFVFVERRAADPLVPLVLIQRDQIRRPLLCAGLAGMAMFGAISFIPMYVQGTTGATATEAGLALTPLIFCWVVISVVTGRLMARRSIRLLAVSGFSLVLLGFLLLTRLGAGAPRRFIYANRGLLGCGMGLSMLCLLLVVQTVAPRRHLGIATSLNMFSRSLGGAIGVALLGAVLTATLRHRLEALGVDLSAAGSLLQADARGSLPPELGVGASEALAGSLHAVFVASASVALFTVLAALRLPAENLAELEHRLRPTTGSSPSAVASPPALAEP